MVESIISDTYTFQTVTQYSCTYEAFCNNSCFSFNSFFKVSTSTFNSIF